jgi:cell wall-associated NlpC family hydrolase
LPFKKLFPYALAVCSALVMLPLSAAAQSGETRPRQVTQTIESSNLPVPDNDPVIISLAAAEDIRASKPLMSSTNKTGRNLPFQQLMTAAIEQRLGARYSYGATGPSTFDCSGFVWSTYQAIGIDFERGSARTLWARFTAPAPEEQYKFGNLVFFSNLAHVGIVADEHGFYHASRHHGVVYSPFNDYWLARIVGFRKVPMPAAQTTD